jgi:hypothetical protein
MAKVLGRDEDEIKSLPESDSEQSSCRAGPPSFRNVSKLKVQLSRSKQHSRIVSMNSYQDSGAQSHRVKQDSSRVAESAYGPRRKLESSLKNRINR